MKKVSKILLTIIVVTGVVMAAVPTRTVAAQSEEPPEMEGRGGLEEMYVEMVDRYEQAGERIAKAAEVVERLERRIASLVAAGNDPAELQTILDTFLANMGAVQAAYDDLGELFEEHAGFDAEGAVTDEGLAVATLRRIAEGLLDLHQLGEDARFELKWDLMAYRYDRRGED